MSIKRQIDFECKITPEELAREFCEMDNVEQAEFFNEIAKIVKLEWSSNFCFQLQSIMDSGTLDEGGINIISQFGEYGDEITNKC
jgi:hypothetical protein